MTKTTNSTSTGISDHHGNRMFLVSETGSVNLEVGSLPAAPGAGDDFTEFNWGFDYKEGESFEIIKERSGEIYWYQLMPEILGVSSEWNIVCNLIGLALEVVGTTLTFKAKDPSDNAAVNPFWLVEEGIGLVCIAYSSFALGKSLVD